MCPDERLGLFWIVSKDDEGLAVVAIYLLSDCHLLDFSPSACGFSSCVGRLLSVEDF